MSNATGFHVQVRMCDQGDHHWGAIELHQNRGEDHYYGTLDLGEWSPMPLLDTRHQVVMALLHIVDQVMNQTNEEIEGKMRVVERPF